MQVSPFATLPQPFGDAVMLELAGGAGGAPVQESGKGGLTSSRVLLVMKHCRKPSMWSHCLSSACLVFTRPRTCGCLLATSHHITRMEPTPAWMITVDCAGKSDVPPANVRTTWPYSTSVSLKAGTQP